MVILGVLHIELGECIDFESLLKLVNQNSRRNLVKEHYLYRDSGYGYVVRGHDGLRDLSFGDQDEMVSSEAGETIGKLGGGEKSQDPLEFLQLYPFLNDGNIQNGHTQPSRL